MTRGRIIFTGNFWEYFLMAIGLLVLSVITVGLLLPYFIYWQVKYFFTHMEIEIYTGGGLPEPSLTRES